MMGYPGMKKKTLYVNLFGGPGTGKSTGAAFVFSHLKMRGVNCEYVNEYAKDLVWQQTSQEMHPNFSNQDYIFTKQRKKMSCLEGKVDVVITDSPLALSLVYGENEPRCFKDYVELRVNGMRNANIMLNRVKKYNPVGRHQGESAAIDIDNKIKSLIEMDYTFNGDEQGYENIVDLIMEIK